MLIAMNALIIKSCSNAKNIKEKEIGKNIYLVKLVNALEKVIS
jgi:hypothetical protein